MALGAKGFLDPLKVRWNGITGKYCTASYSPAAALVELSQIRNAREII
jgi:hypothetical protein